MEVQASYLIPKQALGILQAAGAAAPAGCSGGFTWIHADDNLHFWKYQEGSDARVRSLRLPRAVVADPLNSSTSIFISILPQPRSNAITVVVCSTSGSLAAWMDANHLSEPITSSIATPARSAPITSFAAALPEDCSSGPMFVAAAGAADGSWLALQGSSQGLFSRQIKVPAQQQEPKGMLGKIGSVISWGYSEAFDPSAKLIKKTPSGRPVVDVHVAALDAQRLRVTVLKESSVDCWMVTLGLRPSEQLLWSFQSLLAIRQVAYSLQHDAVKPGPAACNLALGIGASNAVYIWLQDPEAEGGPRHFMQRLLMDESGQPVHDWFAHLQPLDKGPALSPGARAPGSSASWQMACDPLGQACLCLLRGPGQAHVVQCSVDRDHSDPEQKTGAYALNFSPGFTSPQPRVQGLDMELDPVAVAVCRAGEAAAGQQCGAGGAWLVLSSTYGVVELSQGQAGAQARGTAAAQGGPLTAEQSQQVFQLLDATINQALLAQQQQQQLPAFPQLTAAGGRPLLALVSGLGRRLGSLGALAPLANMAVLSRYSTQLTDLLPKQWTEGAMTSNPGASFSEQLAEKSSRHSVLLDCLAESAVLYRLDPEVQRVLVDNVEKIAVVQALVELQAVQAAGGAEAGEGELLLKVLRCAGQLSSRGGAAEGELLQPLELFYARPSLSAPALMQALAEAAQDVAAAAEAGLTRPRDQDASSLRSQVALMAKTLGTAVTACSRRQAQLSQAYKLSAAGVSAQLGRPGWMEGAEARAHLEAMLRACQALHLHLPRGPGSALMTRDLFGITEVLLAAHAAAVTAARGPSTKAAQLGEYRGCRARHVPPLLQEALEELTAAPAAAAGPQQQEQEQEEEGAFAMQVEELCRVHHCYPELYTLCRRLASLEQPGLPLSSSPRLVDYLAVVEPEEGAQPRDTFAAYVFQRLYDDGLHAELLMLPPRFLPGLLEFLQRYPALLWLLLLRSGDFGAATAALAQTSGLCKDDFQQHYRLVCLAKLSASAAGDPAAAAAASSQLELLEVQRRLGLAEGPGGRGALGLPALVDAALQLAKSGGAAATEGEASAAALLAVEAFAVCRPEEREANKSRWQLAWRQLLESTDWRQLDAPQQQGHELAPELGALLQGTALYQGALSCCGRGAFGFGASVTDSGPVAEVRGWLQEWCGGGGSGGGRVGALATQAFELALIHYARGVQAQGVRLGPGPGFEVAAGEDLMVM